MFPEQLKPLCSMRFVYILFNKDVIVLASVARHGPRTSLCSPCKQKELSLCRSVALEFLVSVVTPNFYLIINTLAHSGCLCQWFPKSLGIVCKTVDYTSPSVNNTSKILAKINWWKPKLRYVGFEVITAVTTKNFVFWDVAPCGVL
jgi:hypothetical protein